MSESPLTNENAVSPKRLSTLRLQSGDFAFDHFTGESFIRNYLITMDFSRLDDIFHSRELELLEFLQAILGSLKVPQNLRVFAVVGLTQLFDAVSTSVKDVRRCGLKPFVNFLIESFSAQAGIGARLSLLNSGNVLGMAHKQHADLALMNSQFAEVRCDRSDVHVRLDVNSSKTNSKSFSTSVNVSLFDQRAGLFFVVLEGLMKVFVFDRNCDFVRTLVPKAELHTKEVGIVSLAVSEEHRKLAALLSDDSLSFWDARDNFFEINISFARFVDKSQKGTEDSGKYPDKPQKHLFFSFIFNAFVTVENPVAFNVWDLSTGTVSKRMSVGNCGSSREEARFRSVLELRDLEMFLVVSEQNDVLLYDHKRNRIALQKSLKMNKLLQVVYSYRSQALVLLCNDYNVNVFKLSYERGSYEINYVGKLYGHLNLVRCGCLLETMDIFLTVDEGSTVKFWSLYTLKCIQTVEVQKLSFIRAVHHLEGHNALVLMSKKLNHHRLEVKFQQEREADNTIKRIVFDVDRLRLIVFRRFDFVLVSLVTGRPLALASNQLLAQNGRKTSTETVCVIRGGLEFIIGDCDGQASFTDCALRQFSKSIRSQGNVKNIFFDKKFSVYVVVTTSQIALHKPDFNSASRSFNILRRITFSPEDKLEVELIRMHPKLNLIVLAANRNELYFVNYEQFKMPMVVNFPENECIVDLLVIGKFGVLLVVMKSGLLYAVEVDPNHSAPSFNFKTTLLGTFETTASDVTTCTVRKVRVPEKELIEYELLLGTEQGKVFRVELAQWLSNLKVKSSYCDRPSFNSRKTNMTTFANELKNIKKMNVESLDFQTAQNIAPLGTVSGEYKVFKKRVSGVQVLRQSSDFYLVYSGSSKLKIVDLNWQKLASLDLRFPFPKQWDFKFEHEYHRAPLIDRAIALLKQLDQNDGQQVNNSTHELSKNDEEPKEALFVTELPDGIDFPKTEEKVLTMGAYFAPKNRGPLELVENFTNGRLRKLKNMLDNKQNMKGDIMNYEKASACNADKQQKQLQNMTQNITNAIKQEIKNSNNLLTRKMTGNEKQKLRTFLFEDLDTDRPAKLKRARKSQGPGNFRISFQAKPQQPDVPPQKQTAKTIYKAPKLNNDLNFDLSDTIRELHERAFQINQKIKNAKTSEKQIGSEFTSVRLFMKSLDVKKKQSKLMIL